VNPHAASIVLASRLISESKSAGKFQCLRKLSEGLKRSPKVVSQWSHNQ
jgi:hypothetical protein